MIITILTAMILTAAPGAHHRPSWKNHVHVHMRGFGPICTVNIIHTEMTYLDAPDLEALHLEKVATNCFGMIVWKQTLIQRNCRAVSYDLGLGIRCLGPDQRVTWIDYRFGDEHFEPGDMRGIEARWDLGLQFLESADR